VVHRFGTFDLDTTALTLRASGRLVQLPPKAVELLAALVEHPDNVVPKSELMDVLWPEGFVEEANLAQHVYLLRRAFRRHGAVSLIETAPRRGYCFRPPVAGVRRRVPFLRYASASVVAVMLLSFAAAGSVTRDSQTPLQGESLQAYTLGRYFFNLRSMAAMQRSIPYFRKVISLTPRSPLGYAALADAYTELADFAQPCGSCAQWRDRAEYAAGRAVVLDASSPEALVAFAMVRRVFYGDDNTAGREFRAALDRDPKNALANQWFGNMLIAQGSAAEGVRRLEFAAAQQPISTATYAWLARGYYYERRYGDAIRYARQALALEPTRLETIVLLGLAEEARGEVRSAAREFRIAGRMGDSSADMQALLAGANAAMGRRGASLIALRRLSKQRNLDIYTQRDVVIGLAVAGAKQDAWERLAMIRYPTRLDRELLLQDPYVKSLGAPSSER
jgi:DNA-binding winged helix-turn-helix (wHTH) protein/Tfp pilus assembly protein PilF